MKVFSSGMKDTETGSSQFTDAATAAADRRLGTASGTGMDSGTSAAADSGKRNQRNHGDDEQLPLLDEVNEVIEKERTLLALKLLDQEKEAHLWKKKYDALVDKVVTKDPHTIESLAESKVEKEAVSGSYTDQPDIVDGESLAARISDGNGFESLIMDRSLIDKAVLLSKISPDRRVFELSYLPINSEPLLLTINKILVDCRREMKPIEVLFLDHCGLDDACCSRLVDVVSHSGLQAVDLSNNQLSVLTQKAIVNVFKNFRRSPQYVLLHANASSSTSAAGALNSKASEVPSGQTTVNLPISTLVDSFSDSTWGLSLTLPDFDLNAPDRTPKKVSRTDNMHESAMHVMQCRQFLEHLNKVLDPSSSTIAADQSIAKAAINRKRSMSATSAGNKRKDDLMIQRRGSLQLLSVLGLTHAQLSKLSIKELQKTLQLTCATLTDLDLSFAYVGYHGACMLRDVLGRSNCQLVRLGLAGNALGDRGFEELASSLQRNKSLTSLDCRSNRITDIGLDAAINSLQVNSALYRLNLIGNYDISQRTVFNTERLLMDSGSYVRIEWNAEASSISRRSSNLMAAPREGLPLYQLPRRIFKAVDAMGEVCMYSIGLKHYYARYDSHPGHHIHLQWKWRPSSQTASSAGLVGNLQSTQKFSWEIRVISGKGALLSQQSQPIPQSNTVRASSSDEYDWFDCSATLEGGDEVRLPMQGQIEIWLFLHETGKVAASSRNVLEAVALEMSSIPNDVSQIIGGDSQQWPDVEMKWISALSLTGDDFHLPSRHKLIRSLRWNSTARQSSAILTAQLRLRISSAVTASVRRPTTSTSQYHDHSDKHRGNVGGYALVGYEWSVVVRRASGIFESIDRGACQSSFQESTASDRKLSAWMWKSVTVSLGLLSPGDIVLLCGDPVTDSPTVLDEELGECELVSQECFLRVDCNRVTDQRSDGGKHGSEMSEAYGGLGAGWMSAAYFIHNDPAAEPIF